MHSKSHISAVALAAALLTIPQAAQAQLNLGVNLGGTGSGGLGAGVDLGVGNTSVGVDASVGGGNLVNVDAGASTGNGAGVSTGVSVGGDSLVDANVGIGTPNSGGGSNSEGTLDPSVLDVDLGAGRDDQLIDLDADLGGSELVDADVNLGGTAVSQTPPPVASEPLVGVRVSALNQAVRLDALVDFINTPNVSDIDLDDAIDDRAVSIVEVSELLGQDSVAEISALIDAESEGRQQLLAAIEASIELNSILDREGVAAEDVLAIYIGTGGDTEVLVLDAVVDLAVAAGSEDSRVDTDPAELDIDLLTDDELAEIDLALLPNEEQRLDAVIRILENGNGTPSGGAINSVQIIDLDALLGEQSLAEVDAVLNSDGNDLVLTADLLDLLDEQGLSPEAVVAIGTTQNGSTQVLVDLGLGETATGNTGAGGLDDLTGNLADLDIDLLTDEELAEIDLALLPDEEQRLDVLIRILDNDAEQPGGTGVPGTGPIQIVDVDALLGEDSLAELDLVLNGDNNQGGTSDIVLTADLLDLLEEQGVSPDAVIGIGSGANGATQVFVDLGLGDTALADVTVNLGGGENNTDTGGDSGTGGGGTGGGDTDPDGTDNTGGNGSGGDGDNGTAGTGNGNTGGSGGGSTGGTGSGGGGNTGGSGSTGNGGTGTIGNGNVGGSGNSTGTASGSGALVNANGTLTRNLPSALIEVSSVVAELACDTGIVALSAGNPIEPRDIDRVRSVELVEIAGCVQTLSQQQVAALRAAIEADAALRTSVENAGLDLQTLIGGNIEGAELTLYFDAKRDAA